ncbi:MAG: hypothetical protein LHW64_10880 [Candidatus Cloacimonetes bacterium]|nr:hypothetical protein [Candidatus Cloacimonadota bacterium]MDY0230602.1 hypothetical protein [Candidatus Cloacimonadaceae bacterium]
MNDCILEGQSVTPDLPGICQECSLYLSTCKPYISKAFWLVLNVIMTIVVSAHVMKTAENETRIIMLLEHLKPKLKIEKDGKNE